MKSVGELLMMTPPDAQELAWYEMSDLGNAERLKARAGGLLYFIPERGWIAFDGQRWTRKGGEQLANRLAHDVARLIREEVTALARQISDDRLPPKMTREMAEEKLLSLRKWAIKSGNAAQTRGMLAQAANEMTIEWEAFDTDPLAFNVQNGTIRFVQKGGRWTVDFRPHDPADMISQIADVEYHPDAKAKAWVERLAMIQPDEDQRRQLQMLVGYCLTGRTGEQQFYLNQGPGGDGKSMTWGTLAKIWGDYHTRAKVQSFLEGPQRSGADHSSDIARLSGDIRMVTCSEPPARSKFDANVLKEVTGGQRMTARPMRESEIEFTPRFKLIMECNPLPQVSVSDDGFWRRLRLIPWPFQFARRGVAQESFEGLQGRLLAESSGILNWAIEGALAWLEQGEIPLSRTAKRAGDEYRRSTDPFDAWYLDACVTTERDARTLTTELHGDFKIFCEKRGIERVMTATRFGLKLAEKQHHKAKSGGQIYRVGIRLRTQAELRAVEAREEAEDAAAGVVGAVDAGASSGADFDAGFGDDGFGGFDD